MVVGVAVVAEGVIVIVSTGCPEGVGRIIIVENGVFFVKFWRRMSDVVGCGGCGDDDVVDEGIRWCLHPFDV